MMTHIEEEGLEHIVSWVLNGHAFMIHNPDKLVEILPLFFSQTKFRSFQRQLNMWHFQRILDGPHKGAFMHPFFVRGKEGLCQNMSRLVSLKPQTNKSTAAVSPPTQDTQEDKPNVALNIGSGSSHEFIDELEPTPLHSKFDRCYTMTNFSNTTITGETQFLSKLEPKLFRHDDGFSIEMITSGFIDECGNMDDRDIKKFTPSDPILDPLPLESEGLSSVLDEMLLLDSSIDALFDPY